VIFSFICIIYRSSRELGVSRSYATPAEGINRLQELERLLDGAEMLASRVLVREGPLHKLNRDKYAPFHFILTTDALIYCSWVDEKLKHNRTLPLCLAGVVLVLYYSMMMQ
jgi:hypothetical protein